MPTTNTLVGISFANAVLIIHVAVSVGLRLLGLFLLFLLCDLMPPVFRKAQCHPGPSHTVRADKRM